MELNHRFTVPASLDATWEHFSDIEGVAGCFPGATVTEADAESFTGMVKVKLGPIALVYNGTGTFVEKDESAHRMKIDAKGKDKRGNGTAGAMVTMTMTEAGPESTDIEVSTDLSITGKAAQFGRGGVIQDVSDKLLGQFVSCLEQRLGESGGGSEAAAAGVGAATAGSAAEPAAASPAPAGESATASDTEPGTGTAEMPVASSTPPPAEPPPTSGASPSGSASTHKADDNAIDLGATVLPVLARAYWKQALAGVVVVGVVIWFLTR